MHRRESCVLNEIDHASEGRERTHLWLHPREPNLRMLSARFKTHRYDLHAHDTFVIAVITGGAETLRIGCARHVAERGAILVVNPGESHDGQAAYDDGWSYRTWYPDASFVSALADDLGTVGMPTFRAPVINDPDLAVALATAHRAAEGEGGLDQEALAIEALSHLIARHAGVAQSIETGRRRTGAAGRVKRYREILADHPTNQLDLAMLAQTGGVSRFQVIRDFQRVLGISPGKYLRNLRVDYASRLIIGGTPLADSAAAAGFADQSHLSRSFRRVHGVTPKMYRAAFA